MSSNKDYFLSVYDTLEKYKYHEFIHKHLKLKKLIDALFEDVASSLPNYLFVNTEDTSKMQEQYEEIIKDLPIEWDYVSLIRKKEWKRQDLPTLLINMIVIDAVIDSRPYHEA